MPSSPYPARVQQKLRHTAKLLELSVGTERGEQQTARALLESAVVSLAVAYRLYLRELAAELKVVEPDRIFTIEDFSDSLQQDSLLIEIRHLDWVRSLLHSEKSVLNPVLSQTVQLIPVGAMLDAKPDGALNPSQVESWRLACEELVTRQRATRLEY